MSEEKKLLSQREYAKYRGVTDVAVAKAISTGRISAKVLPNGNKLIDPVIADEEWSRNTNMAQVRSKLPAVEEVETEEDAKGDSGGVPSYQKSRAFKEALLARQLKFDLEVKMKKYVLVKDMEDGAYKMGRIIRDQMLAIGDRIAHKLCAITDPVVMKQALTVEISKALENLVDGRID